MAVDLARLRALHGETAPGDAKLAHLTPVELNDLMEQERKTGLLPAEKVAILEMSIAGLSPKVIALRLRRAPETVVRFQERYKSRVPLAKAFLESRADVLAKRVVAQADVQQSLDVLDRLDALPKRDRSAPTSNAQFNIIVGGGGGTANIPVPDQGAIDAVISKRS